MAAPLLSLRDLTAQYGARRALTGVDLDVGTGEVLALAGENGAGKSTLVRCIAGDLAPVRGEVHVDGERLRGTRSAARRGIAVVWQDLSLCDNLDVAANLLLGRERRSLLSDARFHVTARSLLSSLGIPGMDTTRTVASLSGGQRQLLAVARAMRDRPRLLILDEPTASLGVLESGQVENLIRRLCDEGTTILLVSHDIDQMFRLADRIAVLRQGRLVAEVSTATGHPDEVVAFMSGQRIDSSARRQLDRLHSLVGRLTSVEPSSSLAVILSALGTALAAERLCIHLLDGDVLRLTASVGMPDALLSAWAEIPADSGGGPPGAAAQSATAVVDAEVRTAATWLAYRSIAERAGIRSSWAVPVIGSGGLLGVITVFRRGRGTPHRDELELVQLYAGYAASAAERDRLLGEVTARNAVLETIREVLEGLSGSGTLSARLDVAVAALRVGLGADEVALLGAVADEPPRCRGWSGASGRELDANSPVHTAFARLRPLTRDGSVDALAVAHSQILATRVSAPDGPLTLLAAWSEAAGVPDADAEALLTDAARSLQLALERETSERARREAAALRRTQDLQREFLSRLSHELRTPLTAIHGYADSLLQTDVEWDQESQTRFLSRITIESARLGRLVTDLLDVSAIDSNVLRLQHDWCDLPLIIDAARGCLPMDVGQRVHVTTAQVPAVWADHDRLEQVLVNLMDNAIRHNPPATSVWVGVAQPARGTVTVSVSDDGVGLPVGVEEVLERPKERQSPTSGAGLGLSIAYAIVAAHGGTLRLERLPRGTCWHVDLPVATGESTTDPVNLASV